MAGELGKASLDLEANLSGFEKNMASAHGASDDLQHALDALASVADVTEKALNDIKLDPSKAAESRVSAEQIISGVRGISDESRTAALELDRVKLSETQASETEAAALRIDRSLDGVSRNADQARRKLEEVKLAGGRNGAGVGIFGSGFGRVGLVGTAVGAAALTGPAAVPGAVGLLASIPTLAAAGAGALGTLALAFSGVFKAIGGNKKAFDDLGPSAKQFVLLVRSLDGWLDKLKQTAGAALFPGLTAGLKSALSPGTVAAITKAVTEFGHAIGEAGAMWGRYFGSREFQSILGPLMKSGARNLGVLSDALLHLFDALGVLAKAAIPFTNWLADMIDKGSKFADAWIHAKDATGQLGKAMDQAKTSLTLVARLFGSLLNVVGALGKILYPISQVAVKELTNGLNDLAGIIDKNKATIQGIVGGALKGFVGVVKLAATGVGVLWHALQSILGHKGTIIAGIAAIGIAITLAIGPEAAAVVGALVAIGLIKNHWAQIVVFFKNLGKEILNAFEYVWYLIEKGALMAALKVVEPFSHLPGILGGWARKAKNSMQGELDRIRPPNMNWSKYAAHAGAMTGAAWSAAFAAQTAKNRKQLQQNALNLPPESYVFWLRGHPGGTRAEYDQYVKSVKGEEHIAKEATAPKKHRHHHDPTQPPPPTDPWGKPPPWPKQPGGSGSKSAIPGTVSQLDAQAARQDQQASALNYSGAKARKHLEAEIVDYQRADKILEEKLKTAHGAKRTALYNALTSNLKHIAEARKRMGDALTKGQQASLNLALDQSKVAVEKAKQGSKAWDAAIKREEAALKAEIAYWDKRAHNDKLSAAARDAALKQELSYEKQLKSLTKATAQAAAANEAQFLQTFAAIQNTFGYNAVPIAGTAGNGNGGTGKTDTHLHDIKQETRQTNRHLKAIRDGGRFVHSPQAREAAMAVG